MPRLVPSVPLLAAACLAVTVPSPAAPPPGEKVDYNFQVRPILADRCFVCHGPDEKKRKADLRLDQADSAYALAIVPGKPDESELVQRITAGGKKRMPPEKSNLHLSADEIQILKRWIAEGAEYKPHWAFLPPPAVVPVPAVSDPRWPAGTLDHFVLARLDREKLAPSPAASRETRLATAFNRLHRQTGEGGTIPEEFRNEYVSDRVHTAGSAFLGLTLECCRCHDHKYDPLPQKDYYALGAFFNSIDEWGTYDSAAFRPTPTLPLPTPEQEKALTAQAAHVRVMEQAEAKLRQARQA